MELFNAGRLTNLGALAFVIVVTVVILWAVIAKAYRTEPERLVWPTTSRREARRLADAADLAAANEAGH